MNSNLRLYKINKKDNVAVALEDIIVGQKVTLENKEITVCEDIEKGHKIAIVDIEKDAAVIKYGHPIGHAIKSITQGEYIHTHNIKTNLKGLVDYFYQPAQLIEEIVPVPSIFMGYERKDGGVGVRNEIWIINTVGCINKTAEAIAAAANQKFSEQTDGIFTFSHPYGCSQLGEDHKTTQTILADLVRHPNAAGVLVLGLGCENNNIPEFKKIIGEYDENRVKFIITQEVNDEIEEGLYAVGELVEFASQFKRTECPVSKLTVGLKCGGSDAFSGITANPLVGMASDMHTRMGGTTLLTEVPEMFGAETILMNRCINIKIFDKTVMLINYFKDYYTKHNQVIYENPSPGNKKGGISTLEEKSLGCIQKGGKGKVMDVLDYGEKASNPGLNLLKGPGNDAVSCTAMVAAGAQIILFTTGRGNPMGSTVPTIKISSNSDLYKRKPKWIDYNAGKLLDGKDEKLEVVDFYQYILEVASGNIKTNNEIYGYREIAIFKDGVTL